jgi:DNA-binding beta-propeller fold protein YncE
MGKYSIDPFKKIDELNVPNEYRAEAGFVEMAILPEKNEIWVSQMTTNMLHVFSLVSGNWLKAVPISGKWVKVLLPSPDESRIYASCWDSKTICEIDTEKKVELRSFNTSGIPRGLAFTPDGKGLLAAIFSSSGVDVINLSDGKIEKTLNAAPGHIYAMRHIVHDEKRKEYYITAMGTGRVYRLSDNFEWIDYWQVGYKPNTCAISPDGKWLFVSCRGPNNPDKGYLYKGYEFGKIYFINLENKKVSGWIWGMDQPTGLAVSPDGKYLAFSDFLSSTLELYRIKE